MDSTATADAITCAGYEMRGVTVPEHLIEGIDAHVREGRETGSFLFAVLTNNLRDAVLQADRHSLAGLPAIMGWLHNEAPHKCWGSPERVAAWRTQGGQFGEAGR